LRLRAGSSACYGAGPRFWEDGDEIEHARGAGRTTGPIDYAQRRQYDFFVRHLQGLDTPDWNRLARTAPGSSDQ